MDLNEHEFEMRNVLRRRRYENGRDCKSFDSGVVYAESRGGDSARTGVPERRLCEDGIKYGLE
jgi:hypothetical protein